MKRVALCVAVVLTLAAVLLLPLSSYHLGLLSYASVLGVFGLAVGLTFGFLGYVSFGHAAFFGLGAYTAGLLTVNLGLNFWVTCVIAMLPGAALGALVGFASLRVGGVYFAIATLTTAEMIRLLVMSWSDLTRGPLGILVPRPRIRELEAIGVSYPQLYLLVCLFALGLTCLVLRGLLRSPYGRAWNVIREAPDLAASIGIPTLRFRVLNIAVSGGFAALAGALLVPRILVITPDLFGSGLSATGLLIAILGGKATLLGPVLGGLVFSTLPEVLRAVDDYRNVIFAALIFAMIRFQPGGLMGLVPWSARRPERPTAPSSGKTLATLPFTPQRSGPLEVVGLSRHFGGLQAVSDVTFSVGGREIVGLIGPNGAGKTTCLSMVSGFLRPTSGRVALAGEGLAGLSPHEVASRGLVRTFQATTVCPGLPALENALIATHLLHQETMVTAVFRSPGFRRREAERLMLARACLAFVGLEGREDTLAGDLPYGEQRMLSIAVALAARPSLLLLDEPAAGLNHTEAFRLADLLKRLRDSGVTVVIVDHNLRMMMSLCDRLIVLHHGQKIAEGTPAEVQADPDVVGAYLGRSEMAHA